jgi:tetratricopeptide (TPR) repeat protein
MLHHDGRLHSATNSDSGKAAAQSARVWTAPGLWRFLARSTCLRTRLKAAEGCRSPKTLRVTGEAVAKSASPGRTRVAAVMLLLATLSTCLFSSFHVLGAPDEAELRRLAKLPLVTVKLGIFGSSNSEAVEELILRKTAERIRGAVGDQGPAAEIAYLKTHGNPTDAFEQVYLSRLYGQMVDPGHAQRASQQAALLLRNQLAATPAQPELSLELAALLSRSNELPEADGILRQAVQAHPQDWRLWAGLSELMLFRASQAVGWRKLTVRTEELPELISWLTAHRPSAAQADQARQDLVEMSRCYDRAVQVAPHAPDALGTRISLRGVRAAFEAGLRGEGPSTGQALAWGLQPESLDDLRQLCQLSPTNAGLLGVTAAYLCLGEIQARQLQARFPAEAWPKLSDTTRQEVTRHLQQLSKLAGSGPADRQAEALAVLASCQFLLLGDLAEAERNAEHSLQLNARQDEAYKALFMVYSTQNRFPDLALLYERRLEKEKTSANYLMLAKAYERSSRLARAEQAVRDGLVIAPGDPLLQLALASLLLRRDSAPLAEIDALLGPIDSRRAALPAENQADFFFIRGLVLGVRGRVPDALASLEQARQLAPRAEVERAIELLGH